MKSYLTIVYFDMYCKYVTVFFKCGRSEEVHQEIMYTVGRNLKPVFTVQFAFWPI